MSWYDPCVARWVDAVVMLVKAVHRGDLHHAQWCHAVACERHAECVIKVVGVPE